MLTPIACSSFQDVVLLLLLFTPILNALAEHHLPIEKPMDDIKTRKSAGFYESIMKRLRPAKLVQ
jgi:hypothetical protein